MSTQNPLDPLLEALRAAGAPPDAPTRLATVTNGTSTTLNVRFDGETIASTRAYPKLYAPARIGDRVVMLRAGSTWVAIAKLPTSSSMPQYDTDWTNLTLNSPWLVWDAVGQDPVQYRRLNGVTYLRGLISVNGAASGSQITVVPAGFRPAGGAQSHVLVAGSSGPVILNVSVGGGIAHNATAGALGAWISLANVQWIAEQ